MSGIVFNIDPNLSQQTQAQLQSLVSFYQSNLSMLDVWFQNRPNGAPPVTNVTLTVANLFVSPDGLGMVAAEASYSDTATPRIRFNAAFDLVNGRDLGMNGRMTAEDVFLHEIVHILTPGAAANNEHSVPQAGYDGSFFSYLAEYALMTDRPMKRDDLNQWRRENPDEFEEFLRDHPKEVARWQAPHCFPASTPIQTSLTSTIPISDLRIGDTVLAFDPSADMGRGALVPRRVTQLFRNVTTEWLKISWAENGETRELISTPNHHFLDERGQFATIAELLLRGGGAARIVVASGDVVEAKAVRINYSADTAHLFERAQNISVGHGNLALKPQMLDGWQSYNFEVEELHTYVAGGVRVHNDSRVIIDTAGSIGQFFELTAGAGANRRREPICAAGGRHGAGRGRANTGPRDYGCWDLSDQCR